MVNRVVAIILLALLAAIGGGAWWQEHRVGKAQEKAAAVQTKLDTANATLVNVRAELKAAKETPIVITRYVDRVQIVREAARVITKEIPVYVTSQANAACTVPVGFVRIHDAAAANRPPEPAAGDPDAPAAGVALSAVADTISGNYTQYHALAEQVIALQDYINTSCAAR